MEDQNSEFKLGKRIHQTTTNKECYESFTFRGVNYSLYDCVYLYETCAFETYIAKIIRIFPTKRVQVVWLFRPAEVQDFLCGCVPEWNELFLASGKGPGVNNMNSVEAIVGKCDVVCQTKDLRNPRPSKEQLRTANYFFRDTFDVVKRKILQNFPDQICGIQVEEYFNRPNIQSGIFNTHLRDQAEPLNMSSNSHLEKMLPANNGNPSNKVIPMLIESKNQAPPTLRDQTGPSIVPSNPELDKGVPCPVMNVEPCSKSATMMEAKKTAVNRHLPSVSTSDSHHRTKMDARPPVIDKSGWFTGAISQLWEDRLQEAERNGSLVLLQNLSPLSASSEVKHIIWTALKLKVDAKMIACTSFSNPQNGKVFVIFKSSDDAESAISQLKRKCLLTDGRPLIGTIFRGTLNKPDKTSRFFGHLTIDKHRLKSQRLEMRNAVSTSHFAQPNTIEYDMAMDWCVLQAKSDLWWKALYQDHEEKENVIKKLGAEQKVKKFSYLTLPFIGKLGEITVVRKGCPKPVLTLEGSMRTKSFRSNFSKP